MSRSIRRITVAQLPAIRDFLSKRQHGICPLCRKPFRLTANTCVDHDHDHGHIRAALCRNCNAMEGKIKTAARRAKKDLTYQQWLCNLAKYWQDHTTNRTGLIHPQHKTADEKRLARNARARKLRAAKKKP